MLDDLVSTIERLRERISRYHLELSRNEIRTRAVLIDPMLTALGWDVADPMVVTVEYEVPPGRADYGLRRGLDNPPAILIEAKKLNEPLDSHIGQLLNYALVRGVRYGCLTDGNVWEVYDVFNQVPLEEKKILSVTITDGNSAKVALAMLGLWQPSLEDGSFVRPVEPFIDIAPPSPPPPPPPPAGWTPLTGDFPRTGKSGAETKKLAPKAIRFPDEEERPIRAWIQVLRETGLWLTRLSLLTPENCRIKREGEEWYIFNTEPKHPRGGTFLEQSPLGDTGIIMEKDFGGDKAIEFAKQVLKHFGQDPSKVLLRLP